MHDYVTLKRKKKHDRMVFKATLNGKKNYQIDVLERQINFLT